MKKVNEIIKKIFGICILISLFAGGLSLIGYIAALCIGGEIATAICAFIFKQYFPWLIRITSVVIGIGLISMYLSGEAALTMKTKKSDKKKA